MSFAPSSPVASPNVAALSSATFTLVLDSPPAVNGKQYVVTALAAGTAANVTFHTASRPFTFAAFKPLVAASQPPVNPVTGVLPQVRSNTTKFLTRKGCVPLEGQAPVLVTIETIVKVPAGVEINDLPNLAAAWGVHIGGLYAAASATGSLFVDGVLG